MRKRLASILARRSDKLAPPRRNPFRAFFWDPVKRIVRAVLGPRFGVEPGVGQLSKSAILGPAGPGQIGRLHVGQHGADGSSEEDGKPR